MIALHILQLPISDSVSFSLQHLNITLCGTTPALTSVVVGWKYDFKTKLLLAFHIKDNNFIPASSFAV